MARSTYTAPEVAERLGCSLWLLYDLVKRGECPVEPIRLGRRLVWSRPVVDRLLGPEDAG